MIEIYSLGLALVTSIVIIAIAWGRLASRIDSLEKRVDNWDLTKEILTQLRLDVAKIGVELHALRQLYEVKSNHQ